MTLFILWKLTIVIDLILMYLRRYVIDSHMEEKQVDFRMQHKFTFTPCRHVSQNTGKEEGTPKSLLGCKTGANCSSSFSVAFPTSSCSTRTVNYCWWCSPNMQLDPGWTQRSDPRFTLFAEWTLLSELKSL